jgi:hypothetical protein
MEINHRLKSVPPDQSDLIVVAYIAKTRGLRGEVVADLQRIFQTGLNISTAHRNRSGPGAQIFAN